jgi:hypothetical protein
MLVGAGSAGLASKPRGSTALPKTPNACSVFGRGVTCKWDLKIVASANHTSSGQGSSQEMHANWQVTYKNLPLSLPTAASLALSENEPEGDIIGVQGGPTLKSVTSGTITYSQTQVAPAPSCSWQKTYRVPTVGGIRSYLKLLKPIREGRPWSFAVQSYYDKEVAASGNNCQRGNTEVVGLGGPADLCCRIGGPPTTQISFAQSSGQPYFFTQLEVDYWTKLGRLQFPWTNLWAGRTFRLRKVWKTARSDDGTTWATWGSVTVSFVRRR